MLTQTPHPEFDPGMPDAVAMVEVCRPSHDIFDNRLISEVGDIRTQMDAR